jgi:hypothetical protein
MVAVLRTGRRGAVHLREVDHQALVARRLTREAVAAATHRQQQLVGAANFTASITSAGPLQRAIKAGCRSKAPFQSAARRVVARAVAQQQLAAQARREILHVRALEENLLSVRWSVLRTSGSDAVSAADANRGMASAGTAASAV